jgi:SAM-dependent methyltransferase
MKASALLRCLTWIALPRRSGPIYDDWGFGRGTPIDRWYIERFLGAHAGEIRGDVLEVRDDRYTRQFGRDVRSSTVLDIDPTNSRATLIGDLEQAGALPTNAFDCIVLTQTLQYVFDLRAAVQNLHGALRPGGVCLATIPVISRLDAAARHTGEHWRLTPQGAGRLFGERFGAGRSEAVAHGNARAAVSFLLGLSAKDLDPGELTRENASFPLIVTVRATKG